MRETLEGRMTWERTPEGAQISIPVRRGPSTAGYALLVLVWLAIASVHYWHSLTTQLDPQQQMLELVAIGIYMFGFLFSIAWLAWTVTGETVVILDSAQITIQRRLLGIEVSTQHFRNNEAWNFRFVRPTPFWALRTDTNPMSSRIEFNTPRGLQRFAKGIAESEARVLINRMVEVGRFQRSGESYYGAVAK